MQVGHNEEWEDVYSCVHAPSATSSLFPACSQYTLIPFLVLHCSSPPYPSSSLMFSPLPSSISWILPPLLSSLFPPSLPFFPLPSLSVLEVVVWFLIHWELVEGKKDRSPSLQSNVIYMYEMNIPDSSNLLTMQPWCIILWFHTRVWYSTLNLNDLAFNT